MKRNNFQSAKILYELHKLANLEAGNLFPAGMFTVGIEIPDYNIIFIYIFVQNLTE
jgi:hypothetical protein